MLISSSKPSDWYQVQRQDVESKGGARLFRYYSSLPEALQRLYPEYTWDRTAFKRAEKGLWKQDENLIKALKQAERAMGIEKVK